MDLKEIRCGSVDWIDLAYNGDKWRTLVKRAKNFLVPQNAENFLTS
jgi:hypothetical protein